MFVCSCEKDKSFILHSGVSYSAALIRKILNHCIDRIEQNDEFQMYCMEFMMPIYMQNKET